MKIEVKKVTLSAEGIDVEFDNGKHLEVNRRALKEYGFNLDQTWQHVRVAIGRLVR